MQSKKEKLVDDLCNVMDESICDMICKNENTNFTDAYKLGLITKKELIENSKLKDIYTTLIPKNNE